SEEHTSELQSLTNLVCRLLLEKKKTNSRLQHRKSPRYYSQRRHKTRCQNKHSAGQYYAYSGHVFAPARPLVKPGLRTTHYVTAHPRSTRSLIDWSIRYRSRTRSPLSASHSQSAICALGSLRNHCEIFLLSRPHSSL